VKSLRKFQTIRISKIHFSIKVFRVKCEWTKYNNKSSSILLYCILLIHRWFTVNAADSPLARHIIIRNIILYDFASQPVVRAPALKRIFLGRHNPQTHMSHTHTLALARNFMFINNTLLDWFENINRIYYRGRVCVPVPYTAVGYPDDADIKAPHNFRSPSLLSVCTNNSHSSRSGLIRNVLQLYGLSEEEEEEEEEEEKNVSPQAFL